MNPSVKSAPMTKDETMLLVQLVAANTVINNKATNATNNKLKDEAWKSLAGNFNSSVSSFPRTPAQLRLKWDNLKKSARKRCANMRSSNMKTGGGKDYFPPDEVLDKVTSLLGSTCQGFSVEFGGDASIPSTSSFVLGDIMNVEVGLNISDNNNGDGICGGGADEGEVLKEIQISETPPSKQKNFVFNRASGSSTLAKRKLKMQEDIAKARIHRENVLAEYLIAKKRRLDREDEEKELIIAKLKLELENAKLENERLKNLQ